MIAVETLEKIIRNGTPAGARQEAVDEAKYMISKWRAIMDIRSAQPKLRPITAASAVLLGLALTFAAWPAAAQQWTPQQRAACEPDAMRLCQQYVYDIGRIRACMSRYRRYLSPACRAVFEGGAKKNARRFR